MAEETGSVSIQPSHEADLLVTFAELRKQATGWMVLVKAQTTKERNDDHLTPEVSIHYYCESHLAPQPGRYIHVYIEGQKAGIPSAELTEKE